MYLCISRGNWKTDYCILIKFQKIFYCKILSVDLHTRYQHLQNLNTVFKRDSLVYKFLQVL